MKICSKCKEEKDLTEFNKASKEKSGLKSACKICCRKYYSENRERLLKKQNDYYYENKDYILKQHKEYRRTNNKTVKNCQKEYYLNNSESIIKANKEYTSKNKTHLNNKKLENHKKRMKEDLVYKIRCNTKCLILNSFKRALNGEISKSKRTIDILGCNFEEFKNYLELQFEDWMTWKNHGKYTGNYKESWQIDHKIPISSAKNENDVYKLNHYSNLQPLCSRLNLEKGNKQN